MAKQNMDLEHLVIVVLLLILAGLGFVTGSTLLKIDKNLDLFAPAILEEHADDFFDGPVGPFMQFVANCRQPDEFPGIVHTDGTSRVQTVAKSDDSGFRHLLEEWYKRTGCPMLLNTSLNIKGKPIVNNEQDACRFEDTYKVKVY